GAAAPGRQSEGLRGLAGASARARNQGEVIMADYAGAVAAMRARFSSMFNAAPVCFQNEPAPGAQSWPPAGPWVYFEVIQTETRRRGAGMPGNNAWLTVGHIFVHVFAPKGFGLPQHLAIAELIVSIFRNASFYNSDPGAIV